MKARIKDKNPSINYTWTGEHKLTKQKKKTVFLLEGNVNGPYKEQLKSIHRIIENINEIIKRVDDDMRLNRKTNKKFNNDRVNEIYLAAITPIEVRDYNFELIFEPINDKDVNFISFVWPNGRITEIDQ